MIEQQIERQGAKIVVITQALVRLKPNTNMEEYMAIIREELAKKDQTSGLLLLGYYCLEEQSRVENFLPLYWAHLVNADTTRLSLLISLKVITDFFVKYDFMDFAIAEGEES